MESLKKKKIARKKGLSFVLLLFVAIFLFGPVITYAAEVNTGIEYGVYTGLVDTDIRIIIAKIIRAFLGLLGIIAICLTIYGGYLYMTSEGNEEQIGTAKKILKNMAIGLAIILSSFAIVQFVINMLVGQYAAQMPEEKIVGDNGGFCRGCGFLGQVVESHYPARDAVDIPRNTKIVITFKQKMRPETLIVNSNGSVDGNGNPTYGDTTGAVAGNNDKINSDNIKIYQTEKGTSDYLGGPQQTASYVDAFITADNRTIVLKPKNLLGDGLRDIKYTVNLTNGIKIDDGSINGKDAFTGIKNNYDWSFTVSTFLDLTPPYVTSIIPMPGGTYPRNTGVQINFNEGVDPISASGIASSTDGLPDFDNIEITSSTTRVYGTYRITNQYKTIEFTSFDFCGKNPCGFSIYCLPAGSTVVANVKTASMSGDVPQAAIVTGLYDGVVDLNGNVLNGGGNFELSNNQYKLLPGLRLEAYWKALPHPTKLDNFSWQFSTSQSVDLTAPKIKEITPNFQTEDVNKNALWQATFDKAMSMSTFNQMILKSTISDYDVWYTPMGINRNMSGTDTNTILLTDCFNPQYPGNPKSCTVSFTQAILSHGDFWKAASGAPIYLSFVDSFINDSNQNCFYPAENIQTGSNCKKTSGLNDINKSCYDNTIQATTSTCKTGEPCFLPQSKP